MLNSLPVKSVITPHSGEFDRIFGKFYTDETRLKKALEVARIYNIIVVMKGHHTMTVRPDGKVFINSTGNPGMATGGMGDTLTGIIAALAGQGMNASGAALAGVYLHGLAGDMAAEKTPVGYRAGDLAEWIPLARAEVMKMGR